MELPASATPTDAWGWQLAAGTHIRLTRHCLPPPHPSPPQLKPRRSVGEEAAASLAAARRGGGLGSGSGSLTGLEGSMADLSLSGMSGSSGAGGGAAAAEGGTAALDRATEWECCAYLAPEGSFCLRANTLQGYADCNRCGSWHWRRLLGRC